MPTREEVKAFVVQYLAALAAADGIAQLDDLVTRFAGPFGQPPDEVDQRIMLEAMREAMLLGSWLSPETYIRTTRGYGSYPMLPRAT